MTLDQLELTEHQINFRAEEGKNLIPKQFTQSIWVPTGDTLAHRPGLSWPSGGLSSSWKLL